ncbi:MAG: hypothetical protein H7333_12215 [Bdellovibrionales bacterium]|nr:hypothetical protein [Oligoflexia bacterium]
MKWERRKKPESKVVDLPPSDLPVDYLKLVEETLSTSLEKGLSELKKTHPAAHFASKGAIFSDEIIMAVTLSQGENRLAATTVYGSVDFNPLAEKPKMDDLLSINVEAIASVFAVFLDTNSPEKIDQIMHHSLSAIEEAPFDWTKIKLEDGLIPVWVKLDKSNPLLDELTEKWLSENDPDYTKNLEALEEASQEFLEERLEAIKAAKSGGGSSGPMGGGGPITH